MRVMVNCLPATGPETGGGYTFLWGLLEALSRIDQRHEYLLVVSRENRARFEFGAANFRSITMPGPTHAALRILADNVVLPALVRRHRADLYFSPNDSLPYGLSCRSIVGALNVIYYYPISLSLWRSAPSRDIWRLRLQRAYYEWRTPDAMRRADRVLAISQETRMQVLRNVRGVKPSQVTVIYPGVPAWLAQQSAEPVNADGEAEPFFLSTSAIVPYKNFERLLEAFAEFVRQGNRSHRLMVVGRAPFPSYQRELEQYAATLGVRDRVVFRGFVSADELMEAYRTTAGFFLLSTCESFGFPVVEAMACGAPVVTSNRSTLPELASAAGAVVDPDDVGAISALMGRLAADPDYRSTLRRQSLVRAGEFRWESAAEQFVKLAEATLQGQQI